MSFNEVEQSGLWGERSGSLSKFPSSLVNKAISFELLKKLRFLCHADLRQAETTEVNCWFFNCVE